MKSRWIVSDLPSVEQISILSDSLKISRLLAAILCVRGFDVQSAHNLFCKDNENCIHDPFLMKNMEKAVVRINTAIKNGEVITIYGDYDADGVTSCSLLVKCIQSLGGNVNYYIPERESEGYGVNFNSIDIISKRKTTLIITVDCGITATKECEYARNLGIDMIVTDHHECSDVIPDAVAVLNPKQQDCNYPFKSLAGVGVALKLAQALNKDKMSYIDTVLTYSEFAAIGSIADIVPLVGENRVICSLGLNSLMKTENKGIHALMDVSGLDQSKIDTVKVGFVIAPKINAVGRLENASRAVELFLTDDLSEAKNIASELYEYNIQRQNIEQQIFDEAEEMLINCYSKDKIVVLAKENWHHGVVGVVASRLTKKYYKPCIIISPGNDGYYKGSGRSVENFSLYEALEFSKNTLVSFGGHELAAGLVISPENIDLFRNKINEFAELNLTEDMMTSTIIADCELKGRHLSIETALELKKLEPYGTGNKQPIFYIKNMTVVKALKVGNNKQHLKLTLVKEGVTVDAIAFGYGSNNSITFNSNVSVMCNLDINEYKEMKSLQLKIIDIK